MLRARMRRTEVRRACMRSTGMRRAAVRRATGRRAKRQVVYARLAAHRAVVVDAEHGTAVRRRPSSDTRRRALGFTSMALAEHAAAGLPVLALEARVAGAGLAAEARGVEARAAVHLRARALDRLAAARAQAPVRRVVVVRAERPPLEHVERPVREALLRVCQQCSKKRALDARGMCRS